jgi:O-antigen ligase
MRQEISNIKDLNNVVSILRVLIIIVTVDYFLQVIFSSEERISGVYSNENRLASFLVFISPIFFATLRYKINFLNILTISLIIVSVFYLESRFNLLSIFIIIGIMLFDKINNSKSNVRHLFIGLFLIVLLFSSTFIVNKIGEDAYGRSLQEQMERSEGTGSLLKRIYFISEGLRIFEDSFYMGVGPGNIKVTNLHTGELENASLHNHVINLLATYGLIGFFSFVYLYFIMYKNYIYLHRIFPDSILIYSLKLFLIVFPFSGTSPSDLFSFRPFYFIFGFYILVILVYKKKLMKKRKNEKNIIHS